MLKNFIKKIPVLGLAASSIRNRFQKIKEGFYWKRFYARNRKYLVRNREIKGKQAGRRCFILATGPSVKTQNLKMLAGEFCISVSNFFVHPDFQTIRPEYHLFVMSHSPVTEEQWGHWMKDAEHHFENGQKIFVGISAKETLDAYKAFSKQNVYYYMFGNKRLLPYQHIDFTKRTQNTQTSAQLAIYLAIYAGATEIYLLGCDHDWILHIGESRHFYEEDKSVLMQKGYKEWTSPLEVQFKSYLNLWHVYREIKNYADAHNIKIQNATPGSLLDVFPRVDIKTVLDKK